MLSNKLYFQLFLTALKKMFNDVDKMKRSYHGGILRRRFHEAWHCGLQTSQQLGVDGHLEEAVEVLPMGEAQEVRAVTS